MLPPKRMLRTATATFIFQNPYLDTGMIYEFGLLRQPRGTAAVKGTCVAVSSYPHLFHQKLMPAVQCRQLMFPTQRFGVTGVAFFAIRQHRPHRMKFPVFTQQMVAA
jgi:hypothetical protein